MATFDASDDSHLEEHRMAMQRRLARFNRVVANRVVAGILTKLPGFGYVLHRGRKSGKQYRTPVKLLRTGDSVVISLPYGPQSDWVKNVLAAEGCDLLTRSSLIRSRLIHLHTPRLFVDPQQKDLPPLLRPLFRRTKTFDFIELRAGTAGD